MNENTNKPAENTIPAAAPTYEEVAAQLAAAKAAAKAARAMLATMPKPPKPPRQTLPALDTREGLFARLWARGLSYHAEDGKPLSVEGMRQAVSEWNGKHTGEEVTTADSVAEKKLALARESKGKGRGKGDRGESLTSPFRPSAPRRETPEERARRRAEEEARATFAAAGFEPSPEQFAAAVKSYMERHAKPAKPAPAATPAA